MKLGKSILVICAAFMVSVVLADKPIVIGDLTVPINPPSEGAMPFSTYIHKSMQGTLNESAQENLDRLRSIASIRGPVVVWITFGMAFQSDPNLRTSEVIESEAQIRQYLIETEIDPLVEAGVIELLETPAYLLEAPGCLVKANEQGLYDLAYSEKVQHIKTMR